MTFAQELQLARAAGVTHPDNYPYLLRPETGNGCGVLLVHGFTATPRELRALGEHLCRNGFTVLGVRLPGHGTTPEDLAERKAEEWMDSVERGYQLLAAEQLKIFGVGLSTGALLLLKLSLRRPIAGLVLFSPFLQLKHLLAPFSGWLSLLLPFQHREIAKADRPFYYQRRPLKGVAQINRLRRQLYHELPKIKTPSLVLAAKGDTTIAPGSAERLYRKLGSPIKDFLRYGLETPHVLTSAENPHRADVFNRTITFLESLRTDPSPKN